MLQTASIGGRQSYTDAVFPRLKVRTRYFRQLTRPPAAYVPISRPFEPTLNFGSLNMKILRGSYGAGGTDITTAGLG